MPPEVKEKQQMDRMEQNLSGVSARFDELTARFESSINSLKDSMRTQSADLNAHTDQYNSRFVQIEHAFEALQMTLNQQSLRLTALEQTAGWVSSLMTNANQSVPNVAVKGGAQGYATQAATPPASGGGTAASGTGGASATSGTSGTSTGETVVSRQPSTAASGDTGASSSDDKKKIVYPEVANASSYVGASLQAGGAMIGTPSLSRGWTQALAFAPAAVGLVDDMVADVDNKKALQRAAASAIAGGALLLLAKAIK